MTVTIAIPIIERADLTRGILENLDSVLELKSSTILLIDNGPPKTHEESIRAVKQAAASCVVKYYEAERNLGLFESIRQAAEMAQGDILAILHSDTRVWEAGFDKLLTEQFGSDPKLGLAGLVGATGIDRKGDRVGVTYSRLLHKKDMDNPAGVTIGQYTPECGVAVACLDGCGLFFRRELVMELLDVTYPGLQHWYDKEVSCAWLAAGWRIKAIPIRADHGIAGNAVTASTDAYQHDAKVRCDNLGLADYGALFPNYDHAMYDLNHRFWEKKWLRFMPVAVDFEYNVTWGRVP